jgi:hypothetical protein
LNDVLENNKKFKMKSSIKTKINTRKGGIYLEKGFESQKIRGISKCFPVLLNHNSRVA